MMPFLAPLLAAALVGLSKGCADPTLDSEGLGSRDLPCPEAEDILPCECTVHVSYNLNMYCSDVDNNELARVFSAHFPFTQHWRLDVRYSDRLDVLRKGDLGVVSIDDFGIIFSGLTEVQEEALSHSYSTLKRIGLSYNQISKFPFHELPLFTSLRQLYLYSNNLDQFPELNSDSLWLVSLSFNRMSDVPVDGFKGVPNLEVFAFEGNNLQQITPGTFAGLPHLRSVYIPGNKLSRIQEGTFAVASDYFQELVLSENDISVIEPFAITGISGSKLRLEGNSLTVLDEAVFRPLLEDKVSIFLEGNPLSCECDVAWLVTSPDLMAWIADDAACFNGQLLADLDPAMYENLC